MEYEGGKRRMDEAKGRKEKKRACRVGWKGRKVRAKAGLNQSLKKKGAFVFVSLCVVVARQI